jgi:4a-hydroxytetrahydrobiopterin dehydratase
MNRLDAKTIDSWLTRFPAWRHDAQRDAVTRDYLFADFANAFAFMTHLALRAEAANHHPEWSNVYDRVSITFTTHDAGGLTQLDLQMAETADQAYRHFIDMP